MNENTLAGSRIYTTGSCVVTNGSRRKINRLLSSIKMRWRKTFIGSNVDGRQVKADVGGNLNIEACRTPCRARPIRRGRFQA
jgi:hypothetical protein